MITKITKIKEFGIFKDFSWDENLNPFKKRNLIYGWNYSGKTTLSKLFNNLEKKEQVHFRNAEYNFEIDSGVLSYNHENLSSFPHHVKVFNADYIRTIFSWEKESNEGFDPIFFYLGGDAGSYQPKIDKLRYGWNPKIDKIKRFYNQILADFDEYSKSSGKFSKQATEIRRYLNDQIKSNEFNKSHFIEICNEIKDDIEKNIISPEKINEIKHQSIANNEYLKENESFQLLESINIIGIQVKNVLEDSAPKSIPFPELDENENLFSWVQSGLHIHKDAKKCKFCNGDLEEKRVVSLNKYYSKKLKEIQESIKNIRTKIRAENSSISFNFPHESKIAKHLRDKYIVALESYSRGNLQYISELESLESDLKRKEGDYFNPITAVCYKNITLEKELLDIIQIIKEHNNFVNNFEDKKRTALKLMALF